MENKYRNYIPEEIYEILKEEHRLISQIDSEVDDSVDINKDMTILVWRIAMDRLPWDKLFSAMNKIYCTDVSKEEWMKAVKPEGKKKLWDLCKFIAQHAKKEIIKPIKMCGKECLSAAVFLALKRNISKRGVNVESLRPSTEVMDYLNNKNFPLVMSELTKTGVKTFETLKLRLRKDISFWQKTNIFNPDRYYVDTGSIKTFRDLSLIIAEQISVVPE